MLNIQKINEIKKAHNFEIIKNYDCILNIKTIDVKGYLLLGCFLNENSYVCIITYNSMTPYNELIRVFDLSGNRIKDIKNYFTFCIDTYYDKKLFKNNNI